MKPHTTNYVHTFIRVAEDCPKSIAEIPSIKKTKTIAQIEYDLLKDGPYQYTSDVVLYVANGKHRKLTKEEFFFKRASLINAMDGDTQ